MAWSYRFHSASFLRTLAMNLRSTMAALTCFENVRISHMTRSDSTASKIDSAQAGQKSPVTAEMIVVSLL
nr:hypothetical protein [Photorhabdus caribbeanensis]